MADKPIIFSAPMIRALLDGRKSQTRRVVADIPPMPAPDCHPRNTAKHAAPYLDAYCGERRTPTNPRGMGRDWHWWQVDDRLGPVAFRLPYAPGDRLWVREAWRVYDGFDAYSPSALPVGEIIARQYEADGERKFWRWKRDEPGRLRPSIHMPRWASRLTLHVTDVRVHRVREISEEDAIAEGLEIVGATPRTQYRDYSRTVRGTGLPQLSFKSLWNSIHGPDAWDANPWVAAISFEVLQGNIAQMPEAC